MNLITYGKGNSFSVRKFVPVSNYHFKPKGGLWASPVKSSFGWKDWCKAEGFGDLSSHFVFQFSGNVLKIDSLKDALEMPWCSFIDIPSLEYPDYDGMVHLGIDAIHITAKGERETRFIFPKNLYGWDCESVLVMNPNGIN